MGKLEQEDSKLFEHVIDNNFQIITPNADIIDRDDIVKFIENSYNTRDEMKIWTENITSKYITGDVLLATYNELQTINGKETNRISTAIFRIVNNTAVWLHVHETGINPL